MYKKQLIVAWGKKIFAFILDMLVISCFVSIFTFVISFMLSFLFKGSLFRNLSVIIWVTSGFLICFGYFLFLPKVLGDTFGSKIANLKEGLIFLGVWLLSIILSSFLKQPFSDILPLILIFCYPLYLFIRFIIWVIKVKSKKKRSI